MVSRGVKIGGAIFAVVVLAGLASAGYVATSFERPTVENSEYGFGEVTNNTTEIDTEIVVDNPNPVSVPGVIDLGYTAKLNDVVLASGHQSGVGLASGTNTISLSTEMQNERIAYWWITHVNNGEQSTLSVSANVGAAGFSREIPVKKDTIETDILGGFTADESRTVTIQDDEFLRISDQTATWGTADNQTTPLTFSSTIENVHDYRVSLQGVQYTVTMNDVELGNNTVETGLDVDPGQRDELNVTVALDSPKMADWWANHVRDNESSNLSVSMYGIVEQDGERKRVPLRLYNERLRLDTDILGGGNPSTESIPTERAQGVTFPEITNTTRRWGTVTAATTPIETTAQVSASSENVTNLLSLSVGQRTTINGIEVANDSQEIDDLSPSGDEITITAAMDNTQVPSWWAAHLNNGEQSTVEVRPTAVADVGFTKFDTGISAPEIPPVTTDLLDDLNTNENEEITIGDTTALVVTQVNSTWGTATESTAPINVQTDIENRLRASAEITQVSYNATLNGVVLADRTDQTSQTLTPGSNTIDLTMELDNQQMDEWWVEHINDREQSEFDISVSITVETAAGTETIPLDSLSQTKTIETDILDQYEDR